MFEENKKKHPGERASEQAEGAPGGFLPEEGALCSKIKKKTEKAS